MTISVKKLSKKYQIGPKKADRLRDYFLYRKKGTSSTEFWALQEVSFEIKRGERVGIMGHNGAGKSTLLKVLNKITTPTRGSFSTEGRLVSLLEVGSGFHPELSGRENIFLYGSILGMSRKEMQKRFEEIVAFSGVEPFLDLPIKRFSSGMYARLGFSVAIHVEPDILIIDEVMSVGDMGFQEQCTVKLEEIRKKNVTLLFVGHNLSQLCSLCERGLILERGKLIYDGPVDTCAAIYQEKMHGS